MSDRAPGPLGGDEAAAVLLLVVGLTCAAVWSGAQLAALVSTGRFVGATLGHALSAGLRLPANASNPAAAWPSEISGGLPGPVIYWACTIAAFVAEASVAVWLWLRVFASRVGTSRRNRLGVAVGARLATRKDLAPLVVGGPTARRFIFGREGGRLLATESGDEQARRGVRQGRRSAVTVIGPSQSGKTATVVAGILDWEGPAILSSVKNDLFAETVGHRSRCGTVFVFDPMRTIADLPTDVIRVGWSPLHAARTVPGAIEVARALLEAAPSEGVTNATYWTSKGQALLWPMLFAAAHGKDATMADVVTWLSNQDGNPTDEKPEAATKVGQDHSSEIRTILDDLSTSSSPELVLQAAHARRQFDGFFRLDNRTRSDIYSTAQTLVQPWEDPNISYASSASAGPTADLSDVLRGNNTLYVCMPLKDASRYAVVFGGLLGSVLRDQAYDIAGRYGRRLPGLLCVIDEAGNTPLRWLPEVASTCSGIGVQLITVWQSKAQIDATYQKQADPMLTNHATKVFFAGASDDDTLRYVTFLGGEEEVTSRSANADAHFGGYRRGVGDSTIWRPLLPGEVLRQAEPGHAVLFHHTLPPAHIEGRHVGSDPRLSAIAAGNGPDVERVEAAPELLEVLALDSTPPLEMLEHLDRSTPTERMDRPFGSVRRSW